jgi:hypothetical protein
MEVSVYSMLYPDPISASQEAVNTMLGAVALAVILMAHLVVAVWGAVVQLQLVQLQILAAEVVGHHKIVLMLVRGLMVWLHSLLEVRLQTLTL